jgi:hypothetical protein
MDWREKLTRQYSFTHPDPEELAEMKKNNFISNLMVFGFECGDGWANLLERTFEKIQLELDCNPDPEFKLVQVKQKYAGLRIYANSATDAIYDIISAAEAESYYICEKCGAVSDAKRGNPDESPFFRDIHGWYSTLCDGCYGERIGKEKF